MIEEILTDHPDAKGAAPAGELLKFGVKALLSARPYHNPLGKQAALGAPTRGSWPGQVGHPHSRGRGGPGADSHVSFVRLETAGGAPLAVGLDVSPSGR